ncbi:MAG: hypothetical protein WBQ10_15585 [Terriglobales bacterium]
MLEMKARIGKIKRVSSGGSGSSPKTMLRDATQERIGGIRLQAIVFLISFLIVWSRRPDAILNAQFFAEDGAVFYRAAYEMGFRSFPVIYGGYVHLLLRLVAMLALLVPFSLAPLVMNLCAIVVQILPVNIFLSSRFSYIGLGVRLLGSFLYLALPNSYEIHANITNGQWHLTLAACLLLLAQPASNIAWKIFDVTVMVLTSFSSPMGILLLPIAAALWWKRRNRWSAVSLAALLPGVLVETLTTILSQSRQPPNGVTFERFLGIIGGQVFFSGLFGMNTAASYTPQGLFPYAVAAALVGGAAVIYAFFSAPLELRAFLAFSFAVLVLGIARPQAGLPEQLDWGVFLIPGACNRYYFLPMLAFLASLLWIVASSHSARMLRYIAIAILLLLPIGISKDWRYAAFGDYHFQQYADSLESAPSGTKLVIPINPGWKMELTKR